MTRTSLRWLLLSAAVAAVMFHGRAGGAAPAPPAANEESSIGRILEFQTKLKERIDYELLVQTTLDVALDDLLTRQGIPWTVNEHAFAKAGLAKNYVQQIEISKIDKTVHVRRTAVLERLLAVAEPESGKVEFAYVIRPDGVEITTRKAYLEEFYPDRDDARPPPLAYAAFDDVPLREALAELADGAGSNIVLDPRVAGDAKAKVTANLTAVPLDTAVQVLADMAGLKLVRLGNVYYVTSPKNAKRLQKEEEGRRPAASLLTAPRPAEEVARRAPPEPNRSDAASPTLPRSLVTLTAAPAALVLAEDDRTASRAVELQSKMSEQIDYELLFHVSLDKLLDELLSRNGIPWMVNYDAFTKAGLAKDYLEQTEIDKIDKLVRVTRATVLRRLLAKAAPESGKVELTYVVRPDGVEITTRKAYLEEFYPDRDDARPPPLAYAAFDDVPLREALAELADGAGSNIVLDPRVAGDARAKVTANLTAVPLDTAVQVLADMAGLELVRLGNVYYVTSPGNAMLLRNEGKERRLGGEKKWRIPRNRP